MIGVGLDRLVLVSDHRGNRRRDRDRYVAVRDYLQSSFHSDRPLGDVEGIGLDLGSLVLVCGRRGNRRRVVCLSIEILRSFWDGLVHLAGEGICFAICLPCL